MTSSIHSKWVRGEIAIAIHVSRSEWIMNVLLGRSSDQEEFAVILDSEPVFYGGPDLGQVPRAAGQVIDGSVILKESNSLNVQGHLVP